MYLFPRVLIPLALFVLVACTANTAPLGKKLTMEKCVQCHSKMLTCSNLGKDKEYWKETVSRMADKDLKITRKEEEAIVDYLADLEAGAKPVCD